MYLLPLTVLLCTVQSASAANLLCSNICFSCNTASCSCTFTSVCSWGCCSHLLYCRYLLYYTTVLVLTAHQSTPMCCYGLSFSLLTLAVFRAFSSFAFELVFIRSSSFSLSPQPVKAPSSYCQLWPGYTLMNHFGMPLISPIREALCTQ